jgi:16S rRNA (guanine966-N2)-methyltransferase
MGRVRVIGGFHRSRVLTFDNHASSGFRPTPDRVRETLFNWLGNDLASKSCLDLYAGSGALGFESISRGANPVVMVESNRNIIKDLTKNAKLLNVNNLEIYKDDGIAFIKSCRRQFDMIFLDPPYATDLLNNSLVQIKNSPSILNPNGRIYIEYAVLPNLTGYEVIKSSKVGHVNFAIIELLPCL